MEGRLNVETAAYAKLCTVACLCLGGKRPGILLSCDTSWVLFFAPHTMCNLWVAKKYWAPGYDWSATFLPLLPDWALKRQNPYVNSSAAKNVSLCASIKLDTPGRGLITRSACSSLFLFFSFAAHSCSAKGNGAPFCTIASSPDLRTALCMVEFFSPCRMLIGQPFLANVCCLLVLCRTHTTTVFVQSWSRQWDRCKEGI